MLILIGTTNCERRSTCSPCRHLAIITLKVVNENNEQNHFFSFRCLKTTKGIGKCDKHNQHLFIGALSSWTYLKPDICLVLTKMLFLFCHYVVLKFLVFLFKSSLYLQDIFPWMMHQQITNNIHRLSTAIHASCFLCCS